MKPYRIKRHIELKPYTVKDLANIYGVSRVTFYRWLKLFADKVGPRQGSYFSIAQVRIIFSHLDLPAIIETDEDFI